MLKGMCRESNGEKERRGERGEGKKAREREEGRGERGEGKKARKRGEGKKLMLHISVCVVSQQTVVATVKEGSTGQYYSL